MPAARCPVCKTVADYEPNLEGTERTCGTCNHTFFLAPVPPDPPPKPLLVAKLLPDPDPIPSPTPEQITLADPPIRRWTPPASIAWWFRGEVAPAEIAYLIVLCSVGAVLFVVALEATHGTSAEGFGKALAVLVLIVGMGGGIALLIVLHVTRWGQRVRRRLGFHSGPPSLPSRQKSKRPVLGILDPDAFRWVGTAVGIGCTIAFVYWLVVATGLHTPTSSVENTVKDGLNQQFRFKTYSVHLFHDRGSHYTGYAETDEGLLNLDVQADSRQVYWRVSR